MEDFTPVCIVLEKAIYDHTPVWIDRPAATKRSSLDMITKLGSAPVAVTSDVPLGHRNWVPAARGQRP